MAFIEHLFISVTEHVLGSTKLNQDDISYDFSKPFDRISLKDSVAQKLGVSADSLDDRDFLIEIGQKNKIENLENLSDGKI